MPIVLTINDKILNPDHQWNDIVGVQYHYPNQYKNKVRPGEQFVYYRGVHRKISPRGDAEYFGRGRIGQIRKDSATVDSSRPSWFCTIEDYEPFNPPVPAKPEGIFYEQIPQNMWRNGVRELAPGVFERIVAVAGAHNGAGSPKGPVGPSPPVDGDDLIIPRGRAVGGGGKNGSWRKSNRAKEIGDWAEIAALMFIHQELKAANAVHRAAQREMPGWDIDFLDQAGLFHRVEVKGTVAGAFTTIDLTAGELRAAQQHGESYWIYLVASCFTDRPRIQRFRNPAARISSGQWAAEPALFTVTLG
jgi:hypothetical protein